MAGGLVQLVAIGAQDVYLTGNPLITFFKIVYRRHTNFSVEAIESYFAGHTDFGKRAVAEVSRNGDLITDVFLKVVLPEVRYIGDFSDSLHVQFAWVKNIGHAMIDEIELNVGGNPIDTHYGDWLQIWASLTTNPGQKEALDRMLGNVPELTTLSGVDEENCNGGDPIIKPSYTLYVPLQFYFNRHNGLALPLIALQYNTVKFLIKFRPVDQLYIASNAFKGNSSPLKIEDASLLINYIYLDTNERRLFAQNSHHDLIEQLQAAREEPVGLGNSAKYKLIFNHPIKALYWVTKMGNYQNGRFMTYEPYDWNLAIENAAKLILLSQFDLDNFGYFAEVPNDNGGYTGKNGVVYDSVDPSASGNDAHFTFADSATADTFSNGRKIGMSAQNKPLLKRRNGIDLRDKVDGIIRIVNVGDEDGDFFFPEVERITRNNLTIGDLSIPITKFEVDNRNDHIKNKDVTVYQHDNYGTYIDGSKNPTTQSELQFNGQHRQAKRDGSWSDTVVPYMTHTNNGPVGLNVFSFALNPEEHQPSGTCNFSRIDTAQLNVTFGHLSTSPYAEELADSNNKTTVFAPNYNVARILSGMMGLAYSN